MSVLHHASLAELSMILLEELTLIIGPSAMPILASKLISENGVRLILGCLVAVMRILGCSDINLQRALQSEAGWNAIHPCFRDSGQ